MGNEQSLQNIVISPKITDAIFLYKEKLSKIESPKEQRSLILDCKVPKQFDNEFNLNQWIHIARYVLENDKIIADIRQKCVPSLIKENEFWKRYFYVVKEEKKKKKKRKEKKEEKEKEKEEKKEEKKENDDDEEEEEEEESEEESEDDPDIPYQVLLHKSIIWLYRIPATIWRGRNNKCELWGLRNPIWMGRLRIVAFNHGKHLEFQFLEKDGTIFLKSTRIKLNEITYEDDTNPIHQYFDAYGVIDSSRYFIIWVDVPQNANKRIPFGFGIRERQDAFDIRAVVADQMKIINHNNDSIDIMNDDDDNNYYNNNKNKNGNNNNDDDNKQRHNRFELNDDEMISIGHDIDNIDHQFDIDDIHHTKHKHSTILKVNTKDISINNSDNDNDLYLLPPPPSPPLTPKDELTHIKNIDHHININQNKFKVEYNDDDFGEFQTPNDMDDDDEDEDDNADNNNADDNADDKADDKADDNAHDNAHDDAHDDAEDAENK